MFLYFIPGSGERVPRAELVKLGLGYAMPPEGDVMGLGSAGPGGQKGFLIDPTSGDEPPRYSAEQQTWRKVPTVDGVVKYWIGLWNDKRPTEASLRRQKLIAGEKVLLRNGEEWLIPIARSIVGGATLPRKLVLQDDGKSWRLDDLPEFFALCKAAERVIQLIAPQQPGTAPAEGHTEVAANAEFEIDYDGAMEIVLMALGVNYRVSAFEISMLELFTDEEIWAVFRAIIDLKGFASMVAAKKKAPSVSA